ncbi:hypothetical protein WBG99_14250 [Streptomyces sp. TG1A-60]|uniref:hypothetical protein n=1 Tax=Streptomyces sp. TG1A-60 TaxID=3129111 RepID=UPI0030D1BF55
MRRGRRAGRHTRRPQTPGGGWYAVLPDCDAARAAAVPGATATRIVGQRFRAAVARRAAGRRRGGRDDDRLRPMATGGDR